MTKVSRRLSFITSAASGFVLAAALSLGVSKSALAETTNWSQDIGASIQTCDGQVINFPHGVLHFLEHSTANADGSTHYELQMNFSDFHGTGPNGEAYVLAGRSDTSYNLTPGADVYQTVGVELLISQGTLPNNRFLSVEHVTVTPDGQFTGLVDKLTFDCGQ